MKLHSLAHQPPGWLVPRWGYHLGGGTWTLSLSVSVLFHALDIDVTEGLRAAEVVGRRARLGHSPAPAGRWAPAASGRRGLPWPPGPGAGAHWTRSAPRASPPPATHKHQTVRLGGRPPHGPSRLLWAHHWSAGTERLLSWEQWMLLRYGSATQIHPFKLNMFLIWWNWTL